MKKRNVIILIFLLVIGFAVVSTTLLINGNLNLGFNTTNFDADVIFTRAETPYGKASIGESKKEITFETEKLENVNQTSVLEFDVTNKSKDYDASVTINCGLTEEFKSYSEYVRIDTDLLNPFELLSGSTKTGQVTVEMIKAFNEELTKDIQFECKLIATPKERDTLGEEYIPSTKYVDPILNGADPVIKENLIPVTIADNGEVTYANTNKEWYNYENKEWANAVILVDSPSKKYQEGNIISENDIESYFVWIPRYRYQIFDEGNYTTYIESKPTESIAREIQIEFESNSTNPSAGSKQGEWLTHPAFTNFDVNGLWVGKFETGYEGATSIDTAQVNEENPNKIIIKPNVYSWRNSTVSNMFKTAYNYERNLDSHMMKNTEWGAVAYLSHSKYGINTEVRINNNSDYLTGYSATDETDQSDYPADYGTTSDLTLPYNTSTGYKASTTGDITGIYDMSGCAWEYVAGYMPSSSDASGFTSDELSIYSKYLDLYSSNSINISWTNRFLGDATGEMGPFYDYENKDNKKRYHNSWYDDHSSFLYSDMPWFARSGHYSVGAIAGQFYYHSSTGAADGGASFRIILAIE